MTLTDLLATCVVGLVAGGATSYLVAAAHKADGVLTVFRLIAWLTGGAGPVLGGVNAGDVQDNEQLFVLLHAQGHPRLAQLFGCYYCLGTWVGLSVTCLMLWLSGAGLSPAKVVIAWGACVGAAGALKRSS